MFIQLRPLVSLAKDYVVMVRGFGTHGLLNAISVICIICVVSEALGTRVCVCVPWGYVESNGMSITNSMNNMMHC
eukprot:3164343-Pyramimonas_sp.AAC.1